MKIKVNTSLSGELIFQQGIIYDVEPRLAKSLISSGLAEQVGPDEDALFPVDYPHAPLLYSKGLKSPSEVAASDSVHSMVGLGQHIHDAAKNHPATVPDKSFETTEAKIIDTENASVKSPKGKGKK